jgi:hypothetical protein
MIALQTGQTETGSEWEVLFVGKDGHVENDGTMTLGTGEKAVLRKTCDSTHLQEIATGRDFVEWQSSALEEVPSEQVLVLQGRLQDAERDLQEAKTQYEATREKLGEAESKIRELNTLNTSQKRRERTAQREAEQRMNTIAAEIEARTPNQTQKIIVNQVELSAGFYGEVGAQSRESFHLSLWLAAAGGGIFLLTVVAAILISVFRGESTAITWIGSIAAVLTEGLAASNRLYNQASKQFAAFQVDLDRINRSSISYAMISEEAFEKKTQEQREAILKVVDALSTQK